MPAVARYQRNPNDDASIASSHHGQDVNTTRALPLLWSSDIKTYIVSPKGELTEKPMANLSNRAPPIALPKAS